MDLSIYTIPTIKKMVGSGDSIKREFLEALGKDKRVGVRRLYGQLIKRQRLLEEEQKRLQALFVFENTLFARGIRFVAGVDEAGRGPLAGPVVAGAVILPARTEIYGLDDSKKLSPAKRVELAGTIKEEAIAWGLGVGTVGEIEKYNIHQASFMAMKRALAGLIPVPEFVLSDGFQIPGLGIAQRAIKGGDSLSGSIAAASILAKVYRDDIMETYHRRFPLYGFRKNKGYPTAEHIAAIKEYGSTPVHRQKFKHVEGSAMVAKN